MLDPAKLKARRTAKSKPGRKYTQADLARDVGKALGRRFHGTYLCLLESDEEAIDPKLSTVEALAKALGCKPSDLITPGAPERRLRSVTGKA